MNIFTVCENKKKSGCTLDSGKEVLPCPNPMGAILPWKVGGGTTREFKAT